MHVFVTGATGWIGSATVEELLAAGHRVTGLARTGTAAEALRAMGADPLPGNLDDLAGLRRGADAADAVIHLANKHDWADPAATNRAERTAVQTLAEALAGTDRAFVLASALSGLAQGRPALESDPSPAVGPDSPRGGSENLALEYVAKGVRVVSVRFAPTVHGIGDHGFIAQIVAAARKRGVSAYFGDGAVSWAAVHRPDAARLVRLGLERASAGSVLHAAAEEAVPTRLIAEAIGAKLNLPVAAVPPEQAMEHFGFVGRFIGMHMSASSERTRALTDWKPSGPNLVEDIAAGAYDGVE